MVRGEPPVSQPPGHLGRQGLAGQCPTRLSRGSVQRVPPPERTSSREPRVLASGPELPRLVDRRWHRLVSCSGLGKPGWPVLAGGRWARGTRPAEERGSWALQLPEFQAARAPRYAVTSHPLHPYLWDPRGSSLTLLWVFTYNLWACKQY